LFGQGTGKAVENFERKCCEEYMEQLQGNAGWLICYGNKIGLYRDIELRILERAGHSSRIDGSRTHKISRRDSIL
jgi:hypothetical protein